MTDDDRRCRTCGKSLDSSPYEFWLFSACRSCVAEPAPPRWADGMAPGTAIKWAYTPRWHLDEHPYTLGTIVADGGQLLVPEDELYAIYSDLADATQAAACGDPNKCASKAADAKEKVMAIHEGAETVEEADQ